MPVIDGVLDAQIDAQVADGGAGALQMQSKIAWVQPVVLPALVLKYLAVRIWAGKAQEGEERGERRGEST